MPLSTTYKEKLVALVIDEVHCVKTWGDKFRVAFGKIGDIRSLLPFLTSICNIAPTMKRKRMFLMKEKRMNLCFTISNVALPASKDELVIMCFLRQRSGEA